MSEIKRYNINGDWYADSLIEEEHPQGEWVRWDDVQEILALKPIIIVPRGVSIHRMSTPPKPLTEEDYNESLDYPHGTGQRHGE